MEFAFYDGCEGVDVSHRYLPHWEQDQKTYFVTWRTGDSLPAPMLKMWTERRSAWLKANGGDPSGDIAHELQGLSPRRRREYHELFTAKIHECLDAGHGECLLRLPQCSKIVADSLHHFDGERYQIADFVVMPNHTHILFQTLADNRLKPLCSSWKRYTARKLNELLGRDGHFWQSESYDHIVRTPQQFGHYRRYIADNPGKANLRASEYRLYQYEELEPRS